MTQLGTVQTVVVCVNGSSGVQGPCPTGQVQSVTQAYIISPTEAQTFDLMAEPFDSSTAMAYFSAAFATTLAFWLVSLGAGMIIRMVKSA